MTHPIYSAKYLLRKGISYCKQIAKELGVTPEGDKRQLFTWVEAIVEHQASIQPVEVEKPEATIDYDNSVDGTVEGEYMVVADGVVVRRFRTYAQAERWAAANYTLVSPQEVAQSELKIELEAQAEEKEDAPERPRIQVQEIDFGYYEVIVQSQVIATIERNFDLASWVVDGQSFDSYVDAENYVFENWERIFMSRGSGRDRADMVIETMALIIETTNIICDKGEAYAVLINQKHGRVLVANIFLNDKGWTFDGAFYSDDWQLIARQAMKATKTEYLLAA